MPRRPCVAPFQERVERAAVGELGQRVVQGFGAGGRALGDELAAGGDHQAAGEGEDDGQDDREREALAGEGVRVVGERQEVQRVTSASAEAATLPS